MLRSRHNSNVANLLWKNSDMVKNGMLSLLLITVFAGRPTYAFSLRDLLGPSLENVCFSFSLEVRPSRPGSGKRVADLGALVMNATIKNNSNFYVTGVEFKCSLFDEDQNRIVKEYKKSMGIDYDWSGKYPAIPPGGTSTWRTELSGPGFMNTRSGECALTKVKGEK
jgi:hypothetical protein